MVSGIGPSNMSQLLSFLNIPSCKSLHGSFFRNIELTVGSSLRKIATESMRDAIEEEVRTTLNDDAKYKQYLKGNLQVGIAVSFDMGWNKRSFGNRYDSLSGQALMIGYLSKKIVGAIVSSEMCRVCSSAEKNGEEPSDHVYPKNYDGSSRAIETDAALHLYKELYQKSNKNLYLKAIVADDDTSMRLLLKHTSVYQKGRLLEDIPVPDWLTDPSHRTKVVAKPIYLSASLSKHVSSCTKVDAI